MDKKRKVVKRRAKRLAVSAPTKNSRLTATKRSRLTVMCSPEQRKYMKMYAALSDMTLNDFILDCVLSRIAKCPRLHIPNEETAATLDATERGEGLIQFDSVEDFIKSLRDR